MITGVASESRLVREEIFGPVLIVEIVADYDAALSAANDTEFGLSSSLFTREIAKAMPFIRGTESGVVHINRETDGVEPHVPFGGIKGSSSMNREQGRLPGSSSRLPRRCTSASCEQAVCDRGHYSEIPSRSSLAAIAGCSCLMFSDRDRSQ